MSIQLLHKSLDYVNKSDGIVEKKRKRKQKKSGLLEEKDLVKNLDERFDFDIDSCQIVKKKRNEVHKRDGDVSYIFNQKDAKNGYSLVEQYRDTKPVDLVAHNKRYLKYSKKYKLPSESIRALTDPVLKEGKKKRKVVQERLSLRGTLFDKKPSKPKNNSVFTNEDFQDIPKDTGGVQQRQRQKHLNPKKIPKQMRTDPTKDKLRISMRPSSRIVETNFKVGRRMLESSTDTMDEYLARTIEYCQKCIPKGSHKNHSNYSTVDREFCLIRSNEIQKITRLKDGSYYSFFFYEDKPPKILLKFEDKYHVLSIRQKNEDQENRKGKDEGQVYQKTGNESQINQQNKKEDKSRREGENKGQSCQEKENIKSDDGNFESMCSFHCVSHDEDTKIFTFGLRLLKLKINKNCFDRWKDRGLAEEIEKLNQNALLFN